MKVLDHFSRGIVCFLGIVCLLFLTSAPLALAQSSFTYPPFPTGGASAGLSTKGNASATNGTALQLTTSGSSQVGSAWYVNNAQGNNNGTVSLVNGFNTTFTFQFTNPNKGQGSINSCGGKNRGGADGIAFLVQNGSFNNGGSGSGSTALGPDNGAGGQIGFTGLSDSVAVQLDTWYNSEYSDICAASGSPTSADQVTIASCPAGAANNVDHKAGCQFATVDLSTITNPIYIGDGQVHTVQVSYAAPAPPPPGAEAGVCPIGSALGDAGCGSLTVTIDARPVLTAPFNLASLTGLDANLDAYVGFTGATGGAWETQVVNSWTFSATGATTVTNPIPPGGTVDSQFNSAVGNVNGYSYDFSTANGQVSCPLGCDTTNLVSNNVQVASNSWPQYVIGTPYATSVLPARPGNGPTAAGSIFANACYGGSVPISGASDANCPVANNEGTTISNYVTVKDTFDQPIDDSPSHGKLQLLPGTTVALIDFHPADSTIDWNPDTNTNPTETNAACTNTGGVNNGGVVTPNLCYLLNSLDSVYGDQTTTRGSKPPKNATKLATAFGVPMPLTSAYVSCPSTADTLLNNANEDQPGFGTPANTDKWFNGTNCSLYFAVNPAKVPQAFTCPQGVYTNGTSCNNFTPAPPAILSYGLSTAAPSTGDTSFLYNPNLSDNTDVWKTSSIPLVSQSLFAGDGAAQSFHWSAIDTIGITEKNIYLVLPANNAEACDNPDKEVGLVPPCYNTRYFNSTVNIDSVNPSAPVCPTIPTPNGSNGWYKTDVVITGCTVSDALSGVYSGTVTPAQGGTIAGLPVAGPNATANFSLNTTVGAGNANGSASTGTVEFFDYAQNPSSTLQLGPFQVDMAPPTIPSGVSLSPAGPYSVNQVVTATFTCSDIGSGVGSCAGAPLAPNTACSTTAGVTSCTVNTATPGTNLTFTASVTDVAGNGPVTATANYTVTAGSDLQLCELPGSPFPCASARADKVKPGSVLLYFNWGANLSTTTTATNVTITQSFPTSVVGSKPLAIAGVISFKKGSTPPIIATGASCNSSANANTGLTTVTCSIAKLPASTSTTTSAAAVLLTLPISSKAPLGTFNLNASINVNGDPNLSNNTVVDAVTVSTK